MLIDALMFLCATSLFGTLLLFTPIWGPVTVYAGLSPKPILPSRGIPKFTMGDLACLFVYVAVANAMFQTVREEYRLFPTFAVLMPIMGNALAIATWLLSVRFADERQARTTSKRTAVILLFFPLAAVIIANLIASCMILLSGLEMFSDDPYVGLKQYMSQPIILGSFCLLIGCIGAIVLLRRTFRAYIVAAPAAANVEQLSPAVQAAQAPFDPTNHL
jgi:hypothetical protein